MQRCTCSDARTILTLHPSHLHFPPLLCLFLFPLYTSVAPDASRTAAAAAATDIQRSRARVTASLSPNDVPPLVRAAWAVDPRVAVCLVQRFPSVKGIQDDVGTLIRVSGGLSVQGGSSKAAFLDCCSAHSSLPICECEAAVYQGSPRTSCIFSSHCIDETYPCPSALLPSAPLLPSPPLTHNHQSMPLLVRSLPEALRWVVTPAAVQQDSPLLRLPLPYWAPCSVAAVLNLLLLSALSHSQPTTA
ncbi:unnamed protein product [Closterium sp. NIES-53]